MGIPNLRIFKQVKILQPNLSHKHFILQELDIGKLVGVAIFPPFLNHGLWNIDILLHKQAKLLKDMQHSAQRCDLPVSFPVNLLLP